jgi:hypothetical protein
MCGNGAAAGDACEVPVSAMASDLDVRVGAFRVRGYAQRALSLVCCVMAGAFPGNPGLSVM